MKTREMKVDAFFSEEIHLRLEAVAKTNDLPVSGVVRLLLSRAKNKDMPWTPQIRNADFDYLRAKKFSMRVEVARNAEFDKLALQNGITRSELIRTMVEFELTQMQGDEL